MDFDIIVKYITGGLNHDPTTPTLDKVISNNVALIALLVFIIVLIFVGRFGLGMKFFGKKKAWKAIIPVYGLIELYRAVELSPYFAIATLIPGLGLIPFMIFCFLVPKAFAQKIDMQLLTVFFPFIMFSVFGFDKKYDYQYIKGKSSAFKNEFRTVMPEDLSSMTPADAVNGAAVGAIAQESAISRAASAAAEQTRLIREEQEKLAAAEAEKKKAEEEAKRKEASKNKTEDFKYDIFSSEKDNGPESASLNISFNIVNGKFKSAGLNQPAAPVTPARIPAPAQVPPVAMPVSPRPVAPQPVQPAPRPVSNPVSVVPQPAPAAPRPVSQSAPQPAPGIQITAVPPVNK